MARMSAFPCRAAEVKQGLPNDALGGDTGTRLAFHGAGAVCHPLVR